MKQYFLIFFVFGAFIALTHADLTMEEKLAKLRAEMNKIGIDAYIIPSEDEHQSEYVAQYDKRRNWISGFTGSAGTAVVTLTEAAVWTDGRYYLQAEIQLDPQFWTLMKASESSTPTIDQWLSQKADTIKKVGQMAKFTSIDTWRSRKNNLDQSKIEFQDVKSDLIDLIWLVAPQGERPGKPKSDINIHDVKYAGKTWKQKMADVKAKLVAEKADMFVVTALDEIAWLYNLRAADVPNNPMFFAYSIIHANSDAHELYIDPTRITDTLKQYLDTVVVKDYLTITNAITAYSNQDKKIWVSPQSSFAIYDAVKNQNNMVNKPSPIRSIKARKTDIELRNMRDCHIRDSVARIRHIHWLETEMKKGTKITEKSSANKLQEIQKEDSLYSMLSFGSISAVGANAAIIHYSTAEGKDATLSTRDIYLLDAGAQYQDCTTDITRTHHFGTPTKDEKFFYTRVLQGSINLANIIFPNGVMGRDLDVEARLPLWKDGQDYGHGTGHGIGYFLSVHENPPRTNYLSRGPYEEGFEAGMIQSDEPGYYEDGKFGIRLETDIETVKAQVEYQFRGRIYLKFEPLTFVPFDKNLIDECMLTNEQVDWLNKYNNDIREKCAPRLSNYPEVREFLFEITTPFEYAHKIERCTAAPPPPIGASNILNASFGTYFLLCLFSILAVLFN